MNKKTLSHLPIILVVVLTGCGGGGGSGGTMNPPTNNGGGDTPPPAANGDPLPFPFRAQRVQDGTPHYDTTRLQAVRRTDVQHSPIYTDGAAYREFGGFPTASQVQRRRVFVGVDQGNIGALLITGSRGDTDIRFGQLNDGAGRGDVVAYLREATDDAITVPQWRQAPTVRVIGQASRREQGIVAAAVRAVNAALPEGVKMTMAAPLPGTSLRHHARNGRYYGPLRNDNTISVEFGRDEDVGADAGATTWNDFGTDGAESSYILFNRDNNVIQDATGRRSVILLAHELLHALGLYDGGHVATRHASILEGTGDIYDTEQNGKQQPVSLLYPVDREALRAFYSLDPGADPEFLGPWASTSAHIHGNGPHAGFGVAMRNGYAEPWAYGHESPSGGPNRNSALSGTVTWAGDLVGFTPQSRAVTGDASITLRIGTLAGNADFTALEVWNAGQAPGESGSGAMWGDGDLGYTIAVSGNTFRDSGGDDGRVAGVWTGAGHEGVAGTLERSDLTAAFGGARDDE
ncbi:MAG: hypothetical protein OXI10_02205 [Gammaproteobacteria bacterium]|nr:hypothetical protein [Gammaproteobacteria bacterium]